MYSSSSSSSDSDLEVLISLLDTSSSDSDEDVGQRNTPRRFVRVNYVHILEDAEFTFKFRMSKSCVYSLLDEIMPFIRVTSSRNYGVSPLHQLLLTLRFYALGTMLISVADFVGVSKSTAGRIVRDISGAIASLYERYIFMRLDGVHKFYEIAQFPRVEGAIDGTHIRIQSPNADIGEEYRNRKGYFSLNVQAVCDADLKFQNVVARWPGSSHDATIFNNSDLKAQCENGLLNDRWLLGDSAYPNRQYLLTPLLNPRTDADNRYNVAHILTRNTIERTFGVWKRRFPVVFLTLRVSLPVVQSIIIATAILHNICRNNALQEVPPEIEIDWTNQDMDIQDDFDLADQEIQTRENLINNHFM